MFKSLEIIQEPITLLLHVILRYLKESNSTLDGLDDEGTLEECIPSRKWWHIKLGDYFEHSDNFDRKVEVRIYYDILSFP